MIAHGEDKTSNVPGNLRGKASVAALPDEVRMTYFDFFTHASAEQLVNLRNDSDLSIGAHAAWECCLKNPTSRFHLQAQRFFGFIEGRTRLTIPLSWELWILENSLAKESGLKAKILAEYAAFSPMLKRPPIGVRPPGSSAWTYMFAEEEFEDVGLGCWGPLNISLSRQEDRICIKTRHNKVNIDNEEFKELVGERDHPMVTPMIGKDKSFIAVYDDFARPFQLLCVDSQTGRKLWKGSCWCLGKSHPTGFSVQPIHFAPRLVSNDKVIAVFGRGVGFDCYLDAFDIQTGKTICHFSTNYWDAKK